MTSPARPSTLGRLFPGTSRWIREGPLAKVLPWRVRTAVEAWTVARAYPRPGPALGIEIGEGPVRSRLLFGGDLALHRWPRDSDPAEVFGGLEPLLASSDALFFNFEAQLTERDAPAGTIGSFLRSDPAAVEVVRFLGPTAVSCANNHCLDFGPEALAESIDHLSANGVQVIGVHHGEVRPTATVLVGGLRVGLLAYTDDWHEAERAPGSPRPVPHDPPRVEEEIRATKGEADLVVVQLHWGYEWTMYPLRTLRDLTRSYVDAGADIVVCHHAHVPLGVERWNGGLIAHGLGNLYFGPERSPEHPFSSRSFLLQVSVSERGPVEAEVVPIHTDEAGRVRVSSGEEGRSILGAVSYLSYRLDRDRYLDRVERHVITTQGSILIRDLARRLAGDDLSGAHERIRFLSPPRQRWLVERLALEDGFASEVGRVLRGLRDAPGGLERSDTRTRIATLAGTAEEWLAGSIPIGRLP